MHQDDKHTSNPEELTPEAAGNESPAEEVNDQVKPEEITESGDSQTTETVEPTAENSETTTAEVPLDAPALEVTEEARTPDASFEDAPAPEEQPAETAEAPAAELAEPEAKVEEEVESPTPEAKEEAPASSEETSAAEVTEAAEEETEEAKPEDPAEEKLFRELTASDAVFEKHLAEASLQEFIFLAEKFNNAEKIGEHISQASKLKKAFDKMRKEAAEGDLDVQSTGKLNLLLSQFNKRRTIYFEEMEKDKEVNSAKKAELLERLKAIVQEENVENISGVRQIQQEWKEIGWIKKEDIRPFNLMYKQLLDIFYELRGKYHDLLDMDRTYNLEQKEAILEEIKTLAPKEEDYSRENWRQVTDKVRNLQEVWKTIGAVPRENLESLNEKYRSVMDEFFGVRAEFFESLDEERKENAEKKQEFLEKMASFETFASDRAKDWNQATKKILAIQQEWQKIGPGPRDVNKDLWKRYRAICNAFFARKSEFFKAFDEIRTKNLEAKMVIIEKAEELKESSDWKKTADQLKDLQAQWKKIGPVQDRHSNKIWKRFRAACDHFFNRREETMAGNREEQENNLKAKQELIVRLKALVEPEELPDGAMESFQEIQKLWKETGHVPFKKKDKVNGAFKDAMDTFFKKADTGGGRGGRMEAKFSYIADDKTRNRKIRGEEGKLYRQIDETKDNIKTYEANMGYIAEGKKGDPLRKLIQVKIDSEKSRLEKLQAKLDALHELKNKPKEEKPKKEKKADAPIDAPAIEVTAEAKTPDASFEEAPALEEKAEVAEEAPKASEEE